jgi:hypothetical protein
MAGSGLMKSGQNQTWYKKRIRGKHHRLSDGAVDESDKKTSGGDEYVADECTSARVGGIIPTAVLASNALVASVSGCGDGGLRGLGIERAVGFLLFTSSELPGAGVKPLGVACAELAQWGRPWCSYRTLLGCGERKAAPHKKLSLSLS